MAQQRMSALMEAHLQRTAMPLSSVSIKAIPQPGAHI
jgi:hypothetical protein